MLYTLDMDDLIEDVIDVLSGKPVVTSRMVEEKGILLPFWIPAIVSGLPGGKVFREERKGEVFVPLNTICDIVEETLDNGSKVFGSYVNLNDNVAYALENLGWVYRTIRGSWAGTETLWAWGVGRYW